MNTGLVRFIDGLSSRWRSRFSASQPRHLRLGTRGENLACRFLRKNGYKVLYRNFKGRTGGEIDIVCRDRDTLVFVEVKTRTSDDLRRPVDDIKEFQRRQISRGALAWMRMLDNPDILFRFDVVEVLGDGDLKRDCELIQDAF